MLHDAASADRHDRQGVGVVARENGDLVSAEPHQRGSPLDRARGLLDGNDVPHIGKPGHGIGLEVHECYNLVRGNTTPLAPGMCFSNEPMIAIYGELGIRLEDCMYMAEDGPHFFTKQSVSITQPFG